MQTQVKLTFDRKGNHFLGTAEVPTARGPLVFKTLVPMLDIKSRIRDFLAAQPAVAGDPRIAGSMEEIEHRVAVAQAKRRLGTAIRLRFGGRVRPYEIAGPAGYAVRLARTGAQRSEVSGIGKVFKTVGKGIGKGVKATGKGIGKGVKGVVKNPITGALLTQVPGGAAAIAIVNAAKGGSPGAQGALSDINALANAGDAQAIAAREALERAKGPNIMLLGGLAAAGAVALILATKK